MQKKDVEVVEIATYVFECDGCGDKLHIKKAHSKEDAVKRANRSGWCVVNNHGSTLELCRGCNNDWAEDR